MSFLLARYPLNDISSASPETRPLPNAWNSCPAQENVRSADSSDTTADTSFTSGFSVPKKHTRKSRRIAFGNTISFSQDRSTSSKSGKDRFEFRFSHSCIVSSDIAKPRY